MNGFRVVLCAAVLLAAPAFSAAQTLKVGDLAPPMMVGKWLKGTPVDEFLPGQLYVVEFWATWCGPCRDAIPHLSQLQDKYLTDVIIIGQSVWEHDPAAVEPFVKAMGDKMNYRIATDDLAFGSRGKMGEVWMTAADQAEVPTAFVVDRGGRIAWIGHPMALEPVLKELIAGTFDARAAAARQIAQKDLLRRFNQAMQRDDVDAALTTLGEMEMADPGMKARIAGTRFALYLRKKDYDNAYKSAAAAAEGYDDNPDALNQLAWAIVDTPGLERRDLDLAQKMAQRAVDLTRGESAAILDTLARVHFDKGEVATAIELQTQAVNKAAPQLRPTLEKTLATYKSAAK